MSAKKSPDEKCVNFSVSMTPSDLAMLRRIWDARVNKRLDGIFPVKKSTVISWAIKELYRKEFPDD